MLPVVSFQNSQCVQPWTLAVRSIPLSVLLITRTVVVAVAAVDNAMELCMQMSVLLITRAVAAGQQCHGVVHADVCFCN